MNFDKYVNPLPFPSKQHFTTFYHYKGGKLIGESKTDQPMTEGGVVEKIVDEAAYKAAREAYYKEENRVLETFADDLAEEFGISNHPKKDKFISLCWQEGHSGGFSEVYNVACTWIELLED